MNIVTSPTREQESIINLAPAGPGPDSTLAELRAWRLRWLADAEACGYLEAARQIARWLGGPFEIHNWSWQAWRFVDGPVKIEFYEGAGAYDPGARQFTQVTRLVVHVSELQAANVRTVNGQLAGGESDFFVPGEWVETLYTYLDPALERAKSAGQAEQASERRRLARLLLIGETI